MSDEVVTRAQLLALQPHVYLERGYRDPSGKPWPELSGLWALAAAEQLREAGAHAAQLEPAVQAVTRVALAEMRSPLPLPEPETLTRALDAAAPAPAVKKIVHGCIIALKERADLGPFCEHLGAVLRNLALLDALPRA